MEPPAGPKAEPQFETFFPTLLKGLMDLPNCVRFPSDAHVDLIIEISGKFFPQFYPEIEKVIPRWADLKAQSRGTVAFHVLRMMYCLMIDPEFPSYSPEEKNILKWAVILHDIAKRGTPTLAWGIRDPAHPFSSGVDAINTLATVCGLKGSTDELDKKLRKQIAELQALLMASIIDDKLMDFRKMGEILSRATEIFPEKSFAFTVFKLVIMHQALPTIQEFKQLSELTREQIKLFFDPGFLRLMRIVMITDSINYHLHQPELMVKYRGQFEVLFKGFEEIIKQP